MLKKILEILKEKYKKYKNRYGIKSNFFEIGKTYKVTEEFVCHSMKFRKSEELICLYNFLSWYDSVYIITFKNKQDKIKRIYIDEMYLDDGRYRPRPNIDVIEELQSYEKYFERI